MFFTTDPLFFVLEIMCAFIFLKSGVMICEVGSFIINKESNLLVCGSVSFLFCADMPAKLKIKKSVKYNFIRSKIVSQFSENSDMFF